MEKYRILIVGAGAIGCTLGVRLQQTGCEVSFALPVYKSAEEIKVNLFQESTSVILPVLRFIPNSLLVGDYELILLTVKSYNTPEVIDLIKKIVTPKTKIISLQNGIGNEELLEKHFSLEQVIGGVITTSVNKTDSKEYFEETKGGIALATKDEKIKKLFVTAGYEVKLYQDYQRIKWSKLLLNIWGNGTSAILNQDLSSIFTDEKLFHLEYCLFLETLAVIKAQKLPLVDLPGYPVRLLGLLPYLGESFTRKLLSKKLIRGRGDKKTSIRLDLLAQKRNTEAPYLFGKVVEFGKIMRVNTPANETINNIIATIARDENEWHKFKQNKEYFLSYFKAIFF